MKKQLNIKEDLKKEYFWDVDVNKLDSDGSRRLIIERVFTLGNEEEIKKIIDYYGDDEIIRVLTHLNYLENKTLNLVSKLFEIPLSSFTCYIKKQSTEQHWNS
ncbi:MAG: DUF6922 domain-containing protein [Bacteroidota bacterium]